MWFFNNLFNKKDNNSNNENYCTDKSSKYYGYPENFKKSLELDDKYDKVLNMHFKLLEKIKMNYTIVMNLGDEFSPQMEPVIEDCKRDISIAKEVYDYYTEKANLDNQPLEDYIPNYESFKRLAIIYEKRKEYQKALDVCQKAIDIGFYKDGTDGQIPGRMARLYKKLNKIG